MLIRLHQLFTKAGGRVTRPVPVLAELFGNRDRVDVLEPATKPPRPVVDSLHFPAITSVGLDGFRLAGYQELAGHRFVYQEWWIVPADTTSEDGEP